jgi:hypothetical protein
MVKRYWSLMRMVGGSKKVRILTLNTGVLQSIGWSLMTKVEYTITLIFETLYQRFEREWLHYQEMVILGVKDQISLPPIPPKEENENEITVTYYWTSKNGLDMWF